jgi:AcrR family transcriptional regulator
VTAVRKASAPQRAGRADLTRERVIATSIALLNERGPDRVTTAQIAAAANMNEGNLYYYFKTKRALILEIFDRFEGEVSEFLKKDIAETSPPGAYMAFLREWFAIDWRYRFLLRDLVSLLAMAPELRRRVRAISTHARTPVLRLIDQMRRAGLIEAPDDELDTLLANGWIIATYWVVYLDVQKGVRVLRKSHMEWGLRQIAGLVLPYLSKPARDWLAAERAPGRS